MLQQWSSFGVVMFLFRCFLVCLTTKPAPPADKLITGYPGYRNIMLIRVILEHVTWYDARAICEGAGFGTLDGSTGYNITTSMVAAALHEANISTSTSLWTGNYRTNVTSDEWSFVDGSGNCSSTGLTFDTPDLGGHHCAVNRYPGNRDIPALEYQSCSNRFPFVCVEMTANVTHFSGYMGFGNITTLSNTTIRTHTVVFETCMSECAYDAFCVKFTHNIETNDCRLAISDFGYQRHQYVATYLDDITDFTREGRNVTIITKTSYASVTEVSQVFDCDSTTSTVTSTIPTSTSTTTASVTTTTTRTSTTSTPSSTTTTQTSTTSTSTTPTSTTTTPTSTTTTPTSTTSTPTSTTPTPTSTTTTATSTTLTSIPTTSTSTTSTPTSTTTTPTSTTVTSTLTTSTSAAPTSTLITGIDAPTTSTTSTSSATPTTTTDRSPCMCEYLCENRAPLNVTELEEVLEDIVKNLTVAKKETFLFKSKLVCMQDDRESSRAMGLVASIVMCCVFAPIVISDSYKLKELFLPKHL